MFLDKSPPPSEWFRDWFNEDYSLVYGHRSDAEAEDFVAQWPFWSEELPLDRCLDLGCGAGRFTRSIAKRGLRTVGLDLSFALLEQAKSYLDSSQSVHYVRADIRRPPFNSGFGLVVSLFTSFGYFETDEEHHDLLAAIARLLVPDGILILDLPNRDSVIESVTSSSKRVRKVEGTRVVESWNLVNSGLRVEKEIIVGDDSSPRIYRESVRLFSADELLNMTEAAGLESYCDLWGDYQGGKLMKSSPRMIYFGRKRG